MGPFIGLPGCLFWDVITIMLLNLFASFSEMLTRKKNKNASLSWLLKIILV